MSAEHLPALLDRPPCALALALAITLAVQILIALAGRLADADPSVYRLPSDPIQRTAFTA